MIFLDNGVNKKTKIIVNIISVIAIIIGAILVANTICEILTALGIVLLPGGFISIICVNCYDFNKLKW